MKKFEALKVFAQQHKKEGTAFSNISLISHESFTSSLLYIRNHIHHVGQGKKKFTKDEIGDIEDIISVFFELNPIGDTFNPIGDISISDNFHYKVTTSLKEYSPGEVELLKTLKKSLENNTAQGRLVDWIADLKNKYSHTAKSHDSGSGGSHIILKSKPKFNGIKINIKRNSSASYSLTRYNDITVKIPNGIVVNVGSRGFTLGELQPVGYRFDENNVYSLAVEGIDHNIYFILSILIITITTTITQ